MILCLALVPLCPCALVSACLHSAGVRIITDLQCNDRTQGKPLVPAQCRVRSSVPPSIWAHQGHSRAAAPQGTRGSPRSLWSLTLALLSINFSFLRDSSCPLPFPSRYLYVSPSASQPVPLQPVPLAISLRLAISFLYQRVLWLCT